MPEVSTTGSGTALIDLLGSGEEMLDYSIAWALGRVGSAVSLDALRRLTVDENRAEFTRRMALFALLELSNDDARAIKEESLRSIPEDLQELAWNGPAEDFENAFRRLVHQSDSQTSALIESLYLLNNESIRPALLSWLRTVPIKEHTFEAIRHLFKLAEMRIDVEVFGILAHQFEKSSGTRKFFYKKTKSYLQRRVWWTLRRMGELGRPDYVLMAAQVLQEYTDADAVDERETYQYVRIPKTYRYQTITTRFGKYAPYLAFNQILFGNSPRYERGRSRRNFCFRQDYKGKDETFVEEREEAFPHLWESQPAVVLNLLQNSCCELVHQFGVKVLKECDEFCRQLEVNSLVSLLNVPYSVTNHFGLELVQARYDQSSPDLLLLGALANCGYAEARQQAYDWIAPAKDELFQNSEFAVTLLASPQPATRHFALEVLREIMLSKPVRLELLTQLFSKLYSLTRLQGHLATDLTRMLLEIFAIELKGVSLEVIRYLAAHRLPELRVFAGELILHHDTYSKSPPEEVLVALLASNQEQVLQMGIRIFQQLSHELLREKDEVIYQLIRHPHENIRELIKPTLIELVNQDAEFGHRIATRLVESLLIPGAPEGVPSYISRLLSDELRPFLDRIPAEHVWRLLRSRSGPAQQLGGKLLPTNVDTSQLSIAEIVTLADHEIYTIREAAWQLCREQVEKFRNHLMAAIRLFDTRWDDSRQFAFQYFREHFVNEGTLEPELLVTICDSVREDVQRFGRELITRQFEESAAEMYLFKLSEHPSVDMQLFTSNFLDRFAGDDGVKLQELSPFLVSVLSRVNRGRVVKNRVFQFLEREGLKSEANADVVAEILSRQSATSAIGDKSQAIEILLKIQTHYPGISTPLEIQPVEVRNGI
ncbi:MAG: HEAT repeat domain-containing protein [Planctomycetaceae bacterium]